VRFAPDDDGHDTNVPDDPAMNEADALDMMHSAIWTILIASSPAVLTAMIVGMVVALIQALTQIQEMTLTFVPKIVAVMVALGIAAPFIGGQIQLFTDLVFSRVQSGF
jgi:flagellar biosynthetic protein FliQ